MPQPNILWIVTDDQGYGDLSCMGATDFRTPNLDRLARMGVRFTDFYVNAPVCGPSRAALMSGRYPGNAGQRGNPGTLHEVGVPDRVPLVTELLKRRGYRTGYFGKWHLGSVPACRPENRGVDEWFGILSGCVDYFSHIMYWLQTSQVDNFHDLWDNGREVFANGRYLTELITERAVRFVRDAAQSGQPFFAVAAYNAPHYPMHAPAGYVDRFPDLPPDRRIMAAMLSAVDDGVGRLLDELERRNCLENTLVCFLSDNGPSRETRNWLDGTRDPYYGGTTGGLRGGKFSVFEGGNRVPAIVAWPAGLPAGAVFTQPAAAFDLLPTVLHASGSDCADLELDGMNILPMLRNETGMPERVLFWEYAGQRAVRRGRWKLVLDGIETMRFSQPVPLHLADLETDVSESRDQSEAQPDLTQELKTLLDAWHTGIEQRWRREWEPLKRV